MNQFIRRIFGKSDTPENSCPGVNSGPEIDSLEPRMLFSAAPVEVPTEESPDGQAAEETVVVNQQAARDSAAALTDAESAQSVQNDEAPRVTKDTAVDAARTVNLVDLSEDSATLNQETLEIIADAAADRWRATGLTAEQEAALDAIDYRIGNLGIGRLGVAEGSTITIDDDAASSGSWFIDATLNQDEEFESSGSGSLGALAGSGAADRHDLLSVVLHEQGHILGLEDTPGSGGVMDGFFVRGTRAMLVPGEAEGAIPGSRAEANYAITNNNSGFFYGDVDDAILSNFTVNPGNDRLLIVIAVEEYDDFNSVTFNGTSLTNLGGVTQTVDGYARMEAWYMKLGDDVTATTGDIVMSPTGGAGDSYGSVISAVVYDGVDQTTPVDGFTFDGVSLSTTVTSEANGDLVIGAGVRYSGDPLSAGASQTEIHAQTNIGGPNGAGQFISSREAGAAMVTMDYDDDGTAQGIHYYSLAFNINTAIPVAVGPNLKVAHDSTLVEINEGDDNPSGITKEGTHFGSVDTEAGSEVRTYRITNTGAADLVLTGATPVTLTGADAGHFRVATQPGLTTIGVGLSTTFTVEFDPTADGLHDEVSLHIASNDPGEPDFDFQLSGIGTTIVPSYVTQLGATAQALGDQVNTISSFNVDAGDNRLLVVFAFEEEALGQGNSSTGYQEGITYVRYNGMNLTQAAAGTFQHTGGSIGQGQTQIWYKVLGSGAAESGSIVHNGGTSNVDLFSSGLSAVVYQNVDQLNPVSGGAAISGRAEESESRVNSETGDLVLSAHYVRVTGTQATVIGADPVEGPGQTIVDDFYQPVEHFHLTATEEPGTAVVDTFFTWDSGIEESHGYVTVGASIKAATAPEIVIEHDPTDVEIADGDTSPSGAGDEGTDFGQFDISSGSATRTFEIRNDGVYDLILPANPVSVSGAGAGHFSVTQPGLTTLTTGQTTTFTVTFDPSAAGTHTPTLIVANNDANESRYDIQITGVGTSGPSNTAPGQNVNAGLTVNEGSTGNAIGQAALEFTDAEEAATAVTYTLDTIPANGTLKLSGSPLAAAGTFTQDDLNNNRVTYDNDGSETTSDSIQFDVTDGAGGAANDVTFGFTITAQNDSPAVGTNAGLTVDEGGSGTIATAFLNEIDPDDSGTGLTYTVTALPGNGSVKLNGTALLLNGTFTQDDIDNNLVTYAHDGSETTSDSFDFSLADGGENGSTPATGTFTLSVTAQNDSPAILTNAGLTLNQGASGTIGNAQLNENDPDDSGIGLTYTLTALPGNGSLKLSGSALLLNGTFTQADVDANNVTYEHDGSSTTSDSFSFSLADGGEDSATAATGTFNITVNDITPPTPSITGPASPTNSDPFNVTIDFGETVSDFVQGDVTVTNGSVSNFTDNGNGNYTVEIDATADGAVSVSVAASVATDGGGNNNNVSNTFNTTVDTAGPTPTISGPTGPLTTIDPFNVTINFGETMTGFVLGDITVANGSVTDFTDNTGGSFTAEITPVAGGNVTVDVAAGVATEGAGNGNGAAGQYSVTLNLPLGDNIAQVTGTDLEINAGGSGDTVTLSSDGTDLIIEGTGNGITGGAGTSIVGGNIHVPIAGLTTITLNTGDDDDLIEIGDLTNFTGSLTIDGGDGKDDIVQTGDVEVTGASTVDYTAEEIVLKSGAKVSTDTGDVTMSGTGATGNATGIKMSGAEISSTSGNVNLTGQGGDTGHFNKGIELTLDLVASIDSTITTGGEINLVGTGGTSGAFGSGVVVTSSTLTATGGGEVNITGGGGGGSFFNEGVTIQSGATIDAGTGDLTIAGTGSDEGLANRGIKASGSELKSDGGNISLSGIGGGPTVLGIGADLNSMIVSTTGTGTVTITGSGADGTVLNMGVKISGASTIDSVDGEIRIEGTANGVAALNHGVQMATGTDIESTGGGAIIVKGSGGTGGINHGIELASNVKLTVKDGNIEVTGTGGATGAGNVGVKLSSTTFTGNGAGNIILLGSSNGTGSGNKGILGSGAIFDTNTTEGAGTITIKGTGSANGTTFNEGVKLTGGSITTGANKAIDIDGTGGGKDGATNSSNMGVSFGTGLNINAGSGAITIDGTGGKGSSSNIGIQMTGTTVETTGLLTIVGTGSTTSTTTTVYNYGLNLYTNVTLNGGAGSTITGTGGTGTVLNHGIRAFTPITTNLDKNTDYIGTAGTGGTDTNGTFFT